MYFAESVPVKDTVIIPYLSPASALSYTTVDGPVILTSSPGNDPINVTLL